MKNIDILHEMDVPIYESLKQCIKQESVDVFIDLTIPHVSYEHIKVTLHHHIATVLERQDFQENR